MSTPMQPFPKPRVERSAVPRVRAGRAATARRLLVGPGADDLRPVRGDRARKSSLGLQVVVAEPAAVQALSGQR